MCDCENLRMIYLEVKNPPEWVGALGKTQNIPYWVCDECDRKEEADPTDFIPSGDYVMPCGNVVGI